MKKLIFTLLTVLCLAIPVWAATPTLMIEFTYPEEAVANTAEFRLYIELTPDVKTLLASTTEVNQTSWTLGVAVNIPMGKTLDYYMSAVDNEGEENMSVAPYPFKLTGKPTINMIRSSK